MIIDKFIREYNDGKYTITQYTTGGCIRNRLTYEIVAEYGLCWTEDDSIDPGEAEEIKFIEKELGIKLKNPLY